MKNISFLLLAVIFGIAAENVVARYLLVDVEGDVERDFRQSDSMEGGVEENLSLNACIKP